MSEKTPGTEHVHDVIRNQAEGDYSEYNEAVMYRDGAPQGSERATQYENKRKMSLRWAQHNHENDKDLVQEAAIADATFASHDIDFGGQHYPAQTPKKPKEPQHQ